MARKALITGVSGQDGSYLTELLLSKGYEVYGLIRQVTQFTPDKYGYLRKSMENKNFKIVYGDCTDPLRMRSLVAEIMPDEIYNLAAQSHVGVSFSQPINTCEVTGLAVLHLLEAIRHVNPKIRFYTAGSSEMFGKVAETPQNENTKFHPRSPYGCAKVFAHNITMNYREAYGIFAVSGILFNHESERRGESFVTRKITRAIGRIKAGLQTELVLGNTDARRDWGYAPDYVEAMWLMLQQDVPKDYVIGTGSTFTVQDFIDHAFKLAELDPKKYIRIDPDLIRPSEVDMLCADPSLAKKDMGWEPKTKFHDLIAKMLAHDIKLAEREKIIMGDE
jgi:GDPmannose 4,6-dehydratase